MMKRFVLVSSLLGGRLLAQTDYYNTDAGRPLRIEDASPTARFALDLHFPTARVERLAEGVTRLRVEPALSYGILPRTAVEVRAAFVFREPEAAPRVGMSGMGISVMHALNAETAKLPAIAIAGELYEPTGSAKTGGPAFSFRTLVTRSMTSGRVHANATYGSYNVTIPQQNVVACTNDSTFPVPGLRCAGGGRVPPFIPDGPCAVSPAGGGLTAARCAAAERTAATRQLAAAAPTATKLRGTHLVVGAGADHALAFSSILLMADVFGERYVGLFDRWDWTAELGARHQLSPSWTIDASAGRRFAGVALAWVLTTGLTRTTPFPPRRSHRGR